MEAPFASDMFLMKKIAGTLVVGVTLGSAFVILNRTQPERPKYADLRTHVEKLAAIDRLCKQQDPSTCYCELAENIRDEHDAISRLLIDDPTLRDFVIPIRQPASAEIRYDLNTLPKVPDEKSCLNAVAAPMLIDKDEF